MYYFLGWTCFVGAGIIIILMAAQVLFAKWIEYFRKKLMDTLDKRVKITSEFLEGIKIIKLYNWEFNFTEKINNFRKTEIKQLRNFIYVGIISSLSVDLIPSLAIFGTLFIYSYVGGIMKASIIFTTLSVYIYFYFYLLI